MLLENTTTATSQGSARQAALPESPRYRLKRRVLGPPLPTDALEHERLGKPTALAVFSSDALSSTAYATEEILRTLVPVVGVVAFSLVLPITLAMTGVLAVLVFSYRQTIKAYPSAGGAYVVTKDNLGMAPAQVAGVALLTDYVLTVAVSVSAGVAALYSAFPTLRSYATPIALGFIAVVAWGNLRGVKESGRLFAVPTYGFVASVFVVLGLGTWRTLTGGAETVTPVDAGALQATGTASLFLVLHAFASGGAAVTGVEAISNGVPAFRRPEWRNARQTLTVMGGLLGTMFVGLSFLAHRLHVVPREDRTVVAQIAEAALGSGPAGRVAFLVVQAMTMLILVLAANTSYADFPRLASFLAEDGFMPRQLITRGHRLVFSNGIVALSVVAAGLVVFARADVSRLIPLYAIGVFTSFTLSQIGMATHHLRLREPGWRTGLAINGLGGLVTAVVAVIVGVTKFVHGAWVIVVLVPFLVLLLRRLNRQYAAEERALEHNAIAACEAPILRHHAVIVMVADLDNSVARALQYARTLMPDELRAVHVAADPERAEQVMSDWARLGLRLPLEVVECPDRRVERTTAELVSELLDGETEVTVLIPRREYTRLWHRLLHDRTSDRLARVVMQLPHANATFVPYHLGGA